MVKRVVQVEVLDVEKRRLPSKHYVYVMEVFWSDGTKNIIYRRYTQFFDLQVHLLDHFPVQAGTKNPSQRVIPYLPGKKLFVRSHTYEAASSRIYPLRQYCKGLIKLDDEISLYDHVLKFFEVNNSDLNPPDDSKNAKGRNKPGNSKAPEKDIDSEPINAESYIAIANYKKVEKNEISLIEGIEVDVIEKRKNGWWFVTVEDDQGWVPASFLRKLTTTDQEYKKIEPVVTDVRNELYVGTEDVEPENSDEIKLCKGAPVEVLKKSETGWWLVKCNGKTGWAPRARLERPQYSSKVLLRREHVEKQISDYYAKDNITLQQVNPETNPAETKNERRDSFRQRVQSIYMTADEFESNDPNCVSFNIGATAEIIEKCGDWWFVKIDDKEGWAPASHIDKTTLKSTKPPSLQRSPKPLVKSLAAKPSPAAPESKDQQKIPPPKPARSGIVGVKPKKNSNVTKGDNKSNENVGINHDIPSVEKPKPLVSPRPKPFQRNNDSTSMDVSSKSNQGLGPGAKNNQNTPTGSGNVSSALQQMRAKLKAVSPTAKDQSAHSETGQNLSVNQTVNISKSVAPNRKQLPPRPNLVSDNTELNQIPNKKENSRSNVSNNSGNVQDVKTAAVVSNSELSHPVVKVYELYKALYDFEKTFDGTINVKEGDRVQVIEKNEDGWWLVKNNTEEGFVPGNYLEIVPASFKPPRPPKPKFKK